MRIFKSKLFVLLFVAVSVIVISTGWLATPTAKIEQPKLFEWIEAGYSRQFCNTIFTHISDCVTIKSSECDALVIRQLAPCLDELKTKLPAEVKVTESKKIYDDISGCFQKSMHDELMNNYLIYSPECRQKLS